VPMSNPTMGEFCLAIVLPLQTLDVRCQMSDVRESLGVSLPLTSNI
jgi:hypothetical protein